MRSLFCLTVLAVAGSAAAADAATGLEFQHHDWMLACDNTRTCRAAGYQADDGDSAPVSVLLTRKAGPGTPVQAELMLGSYDGDAELPQTLRLQINGSDLGTLPLAGESATLSATQTSALLAALHRDSAIVAAGDNGKRWTLSDQGASAVLLKMDEFQGRLGTAGALIRKGTRNEDGVLPALPVPTVTLAALPPTTATDTALAASPELRAALAAATSADDCDALGPDASPLLDDDARALHVTRLSKDKLLVSMLCWRGAYNEGSGYWVVNARAPYQPLLVTTLGGDDDGRTITAANKGRGLGDCWSTTAWGWNGSAFVKTADASTGLCRLVAAGGAWDMPTVVTEVTP